MEQVHWPGACKVRRRRDHLGGEVIVGTFSVMVRSNKPTTTGGSELPGRTWNPGQKVPSSMKTRTSFRSIDSGSAVWVSYLCKLLQGRQGELLFDRAADRRCPWLLSLRSRCSSLRRLSGGRSVSGGGPGNRMNR